MPELGETRGRRVGRYVLFEPIASGGMATVHLGRLFGPGGFARTVAIKRLHSQFARDPEFVAMFLDEARLAARVRHPNVVSILDVVAIEGELFLVMDYVQGEVLSKLLRAAREQSCPPSPHTVVAILAGVLHGLHAAHEAKSERGEPLAIVHRDVSPQNVMVGTDGVARVLDFGVAKAARRLQQTQGARIKGKLRYMAPEQVTGAGVDRRTDVFAASIVAWEALAGRRLFQAREPSLIMQMILKARLPSLTELAGETRPSLASLPAAVDRAVMRGLARSPAERFQTARDMAIALEDALSPATTTQVGAWVEKVLGGALAERAGRVREIEAVSAVEDMPRRPGVEIPLSEDSDPSVGGGAQAPASLGTEDEESEAATRVHEPPTEEEGATRVREPPTEEGGAARLREPPNDAAAATLAAPPDAVDATLVAARVTRERKRKMIAWVAVSVCAALGVLLAAAVQLASRSPDSSEAGPDAVQGRTVTRPAPPPRSVEVVPIASIPAQAAAEETVVAQPAPQEPRATAGSPAANAATIGSPAANAATIGSPAANAAAIGSRPTDTPRAPATPARRRLEPAAAPVGSTAPRPGCDPPFTIDEAGDKHFKPHCI